MDKNIFTILGSKQGFHKLWKSWKITKNSVYWKIMEYEKNLNNHGKIMEFCEIIWQDHQ